MTFLLFPLRDLICRIFPSVIDVSVCKNMHDVALDTCDVAFNFLTSASRVKLLALRAFVLSYAIHFYIP